MSRHRAQPPSTATPAPPSPPAPDAPGAPGAGGDALTRLRAARRRAHDAIVEPSAPTPRDPLPATGKAGRNLPAAVGVGLSLLTLLIVSLVFDPIGFAALALAAILVAEWELARAFAVRHIRIPLPPLWVGTVGIVVSTWVAGAEGLLTAYLLTCGAVVLWRAVDGGGPDAVRDALCAVFATTYLPFLAGFAILLAAAPQGAALVFTVIALGVANDTGGYIAGVKFGKHPMAPSVSPKKSWEGFVGSLLLAGLVGALMVRLALDGPVWVGLLIGAVCVLASTAGDLAESLIKRDLGLKDMSDLLPGHGGVLDRLDSLLVCAPVAYALLFVLLGW